MEFRIFATLLVCLATIFGQADSASTEQPKIKISYKPSADSIKEMSGFDFSGAVFALSGKDGRWEKSLALVNRVEVVEFTGFDPKESHTLSVRFKEVGTLNGVKPGKGHESGEAYKYKLPAGSYDLEFLPAECDGKKTDTWLGYALFSADRKVKIAAVGFMKGCKHR